MSIFQKRRNLKVFVLLIIIVVAGLSVYAHNWVSVHHLPTVSYDQALSNMLYTNYTTISHQDSKWLIKLYVSSQGYGSSVGIYKVQSGSQNLDIKLANIKVNSALMNSNWLSSNSIQILHTLNHDNYMRFSLIIYLCSIMVLIV